MAIKFDFQGFDSEDTVRKEIRDHLLALAEVIRDSPPYEGASIAQREAEFRAARDLIALARKF